MPAVKTANSKPSPLTGALIPYVAAVTPETFASEPATSQIDQHTHDLQDINIILSHEAITTPTPSNHTNLIPVYDENEVNYTLTRWVKPDDSNHLNHSCLSELLINQNLLPNPKKRNVSVLNEKRRNYPAKYYYEGYFAQCGLMTLLEQNLATQVCMCDVKPKAIQDVNPTGLCNRWRFCWPCANRAAQKTLKTFQPRFHRHKWGFLTISYDGQLPLTHLSGSEWWVYWDAARLALKRLAETNGVNGAIYREELAIPSLSPTTAIPHLHAIVPTDFLSPGAMERLSHWVVGHRDDMGDGIRLVPSIDFRPIPTEEDFVRVVQYLYKPLNLVLPYTSRWRNEASVEDRRALNRSMRDLIEAIIAFSKGRSQIGYFGNMRAASKSIFIGVPSEPKVKRSKRK